MFGCWICYVRGLDFLRLGDSNSYFGGLDLLRLRVSNSYVRGLDFLCLGVIFVMFGGY